MTRAERIERIAAIIDQRKPLATRIQSAIAHLETLREALGRIDAKRRELLQKVNEDEIQGKLSSLDFRTPHYAITEQVAVLEKLQKRFERPTLNIGVVGLMGQGKSTLLQSITGLENEVIPAKGGVGACTAVKSTIYHRPGQPTEAEITFHSKNSLFQEVILPHFKSEELGLSPEPSDFDDFIYSSFPVYAQDDNNAWKIEMIDRLKKDYYDQSSYRSVLGKSLQLVSKSEIKGYVSHFDPDNNPNNYKNLAVKEVKIFCDFDNNDVGQIALVDIPGLGDHVLGDKELMLKALGEEVDIVLFVRRPEPIRANWDTKDTELYSQAAKALNDLKSRSFMILNQVSREYNNEAICRILQSEISRRAIKVVDCFVTDCSNSEEVNSKVLDQVLNYLSSKITDLDLKLAQFYQEKLNQLQQSIQTEIDKADGLLGGVANNQDFNNFLPLFNQYWDVITNELESLLKKLRERREEEDIDFKDKVEEVLQNCRTDTSLPTIEQIEIRANAQGGYPNAYFEYIKEIRPHLSQHFLSLDEGLQKSLLGVKSQVAQVLFEQGKLGSLVQFRDYHFFKELLEKDLIPPELLPNQPSKLKFGFELLANFELSYRGMIQHRIRQNLDILTPNDPKVPKLSNSPSAQEILVNLKTAYFEAVYHCENDLRGWLCEPSQAAFAIIEEFLDRILRVADVKSEWQAFLFFHRSEIWPSVFQALADKTQLQQDWLEATQRVKNANQSSLLQFIN
jgi:hypothetical protein